MRSFRLLMVIAAVTLVALLYVHQHVELVKMSYTIECKERKLKEMLDRNDGLGYNISNLESPLRLEQVLLAKQIEIGFPRRDHVVSQASLAAKRGGRIQAVSRSKAFDILSFFDFLSAKAEAQANEE